MKIEVMLYIYGAVCISMIVFNIIYNLLLQHREPLLKRRYRKMKNQIAFQLQNIENNGKITENHLHFLAKKLRRINGLIVFYRVISEMKKEPINCFDLYLNQIQPVVLYLAVEYLDKENLQAGYFTYFLSQCKTRRYRPMDSLQDILLKYLEKDNLYCRCNALQALYDFGNEDHVIAALQLQDDGKVFIHEKILTEGLLSFTGDHEALIQKLWIAFSSFSVHTQQGILNYIRFQSGNYPVQMFSIMQNETMDKELRLSAIRYFGKYYYAPALEPLLHFVQDNDPDHWEYATVAASALSLYGQEKVIEVLKDALCSENWYIRYAAAQSLTAHHVEYSDLKDILLGNDRYAREMITYHLESTKLQHAEV